MGCEKCHEPRHESGTQRARAIPKVPPRTVRGSASDLNTGSPDAWASAMQQALGNAMTARIVESAAPVIRRSCAKCASESKSDVSDYLATSASTGHPLDAATRSAFEASFGVPLDRVRVTADDASARAAQSLGARAFTLGSSIWFGRGEYRPNVPEGRRLLAHEVAHSVQQGMAAPSLQRRLVVGHANDPAESEADRAADAVMRGDPAVLRGAGPPRVQRQPVPGATPAPNALPECTGSPGNNANERIVRCPDGVYTVRMTTREAQPGPNTIHATPGQDSQDIWLDIEVCRNGTQVNVVPRGNVPASASQILQNVLQAQPALGGVTLGPGVEIRVLPARPGRVRSVDVDLRGGYSPDTRGWSIGGSATVTTPGGDFGGTIDYSETPQAGGSPNRQITGGIIYRPGARPPQNRCRPGTPARVDFTCTRATTIPGRLATPELRRTPTTTIYVLFRYTEAHIVGWRFEGDDTTYSPGDSHIHDRVMELVLAEGFRPSDIVGYTSPEGLREGSPGGFQGNDSLSRARAIAAQRALFNDVCLGCPTWEDAPIIPVGMSELYSPPPRMVHGRMREVEGDELARAAVDAVMAMDPLRPADTEAFRRQTLAQKRQQIYPLLRRAEITMRRDPILLARQSGTPDRPGPDESVTCPENVIHAARDAFGLPSA